MLSALKKKKSKNACVLNSDKVTVYDFSAPGTESVCEFGSELSFRLLGKTLRTKQVSPSGCLEVFIIVFGESFNPVIGCLG